MSKRQEILEETYHLFSEYGYGVSLSQITGKLGLKKQSIYNYYDSKDELILEMLSWKATEYFDGLMNVLYETQKDLPDVRLNTIMRFILNYFKNPEHLRLRRWVLISDIHDGINIIHELSKKYESAYFEELRKIIQECIDMGLIESNDVEDVFISFLVIVRGLIDGMFIYTRFSNRDEIVEKMIEKFWKMI